MEHRNMRFRKKPISNISLVCADERHERAGGSTRCGFRSCAPGTPCSQCPSPHPQVGNWTDWQVLGRVGAGGPGGRKAVPLNPNLCLECRDTVSRGPCPRHPVVGPQGRGRLCSPESGSLAH